MKREEVVRWVENHRAAERRERQELARNAPDVDGAIAAGLALTAIYGAMHGSSESSATERFAS